MARVACRERNLWFHLRRRIEKVWLPAETLPAAKQAILELPHLKTLLISTGKCNSAAGDSMKIAQLTQLLARERPEVKLTVHRYECSDL